MTAEIATLTLDALTLALRVYVALLLVVAGLAKLRTPLEFEASLSAYRIVPDALLAPVARLLPPVELALAALLLVPGLSTVASIAAAALLFAFAAAIGINLTRGRAHIDCGCGGTSMPIRWTMVYRNLVTALLLAATAPAAASVHPLLLLGAIVAGVGIYLVHRICDMLSTLAAPFRPTA